MAERAQRILGSIAKHPYLNLHHKGAGNELPVKIHLNHSKDTRMKEEVVRHQLQILGFLIEFLQEAANVNWEEATLEQLCQEIEIVKEKWKGFKAAYQNKVKEVEVLIPELLKKIQLLQRKKTQLEESLQRYHYKAKQQQEEALQKQQQMVKKCQECQDHIQLLNMEVEKLEQSVDTWMRSVNKDSSLLELLRTLQGITLVPILEKELVLDLYASETLASLRVNVKLTSEGQFQIKTEDSMPCLPPELQHGDISHIIPVILELKFWYRSHGQLLAEMKELRDRFIIDWLPVEQQIILLKGSMQYTLHVEPGYPQSGGVKLLSAKGMKTASRRLPITNRMAGIFDFNPVWQITEFKTQ
ncbi:outer kinetochore KNL1 complex subunit ZWINT isoform X2 [Pyxicephalus adspersus]|uniref:outer kinetochore KNL1 complex subunit ZWINT isoform X2 n=1 Tax=Pyxicephalus adspersus TaxID=30357 RepID=UPI003B5BAABD